jgi:hypothetical protein
LDVHLRALKRRFQGDRMKRGVIFYCIVLSALASPVLAQQEPDLDYRPVIEAPAYELGKGPRVAIDEAHHNFHTAGGRYKPFAELLRRDGYRVRGLDSLSSSSTLKTVDVLVIANPLHERNVEDWALPTPSAFTADEISAIRAWVEKGGSLFLILDHMPFPGAGGELAKAFGVRFSNGFAVLKSTGMPSTFIFSPDSGGLAESAITKGRMEKERVTEVATYTGSAFMTPKDAIPILGFNGNFESLTPDTAWQFTASTPREPLEGWCQGAVMKAGGGRIAVFGEAAMFTAQLAGVQRLRIGMNAPEASQNHRLLLNVMHWLTRMEGILE